MSSMLDGIKSMIRQQSAYQEAASLLVEDATGRGIDDIILGQNNSRPIFESEDEMSYDGPEDMELGTEAEDPEAEVDDTEIANPEENDGPESGPKPPSAGDETVPETDMGAEEIGDEDSDETPAPPKPEEDPDDIGNMAIDDPAPQGGDQPLSVPGSDGLPEPTGGDVPAASNDDNLVDVNLDLQSNTMRDVLPVPPAGAAQAVASDTMDQRVDSGFGGDSPEAPLNPATPGPGAEPPSPVGAPATEDADDAGAMEIGGDDSTGDGIGEVPVGESGGLDPAAMLKAELKMAESAKKQLEDMAKRTPSVTSKLKPLIEDREKRIKELQKQIDEVSKDNSFTEAITLGGDGSGGGDGGAVTANDAAGGDAGSPPDEEIPDDASVDSGSGDGENPVTAAVRDKVAEEEGIGGDGEGAPANNEELMKTLSSLTKKIEDAKQLVMSKIST